MEKIFEKSEVQIVEKTLQISVADRTQESLRAQKNDMEVVVPDGKLLQHPQETTSRPPAPMCASTATEEPQVVDVDTLKADPIGPEDMIVKRGSPDA